MQKSAATVSDRRRKKRPGVGEQTEIIRKAAISLFAEKGTRAVSIALICDHADVSRPTFYRCFEDKDALLASIYEDAVNLHVEGFLTKASLRNPEKLRMSMDALLEAIYEHADLARLLFVESSDSSSPAARIIDRAFDQVADELARGLNKAGQKAPSQVYLKAVMAAIQWIVHDAMRQGLTPKARQEASAAAFDLAIATLSLSLIHI